MALRVLPLGLVLLGLAFAVGAAFTSVSSQKGLRRLAASVLIAAAFVVGSVAQMLGEHRLWPGAFGIGAGAFLVWVGWRKYKRDPHGHTRPAQIL